jgi:hypothetical protein
MIQDGAFRLFVTDAIDENAPRFVRVAGWYA